MKYSYYDTTINITLCRLNIRKGKALKGLGLKSSNPIIFS